MLALPQATSVSVSSRVGAEVISAVNQHDSSRLVGIGCPLKVSYQIAPLRRGK
jgi:hypothetical protein